MNKVYYQDGNTPLTPEELAHEANAITRRPCFAIYDFIGDESRISGSGHCDCDGEGEFELLDADDPMVIEGKKRYMRCRICGCYSHL